jgi:hypothetical protein
MEAGSLWLVGCSVFCSYHYQRKTLRMKPWETPPMDIENAEVSLLLPPDHRGEHQAAQLLKKMQACGVSRFHPDPMAAIEAAKARR